MLHDDYNCAIQKSGVVYGGLSMVMAITVLLGIILFGVILLGVIVSRAMPYDPAWDDPPNDKVVNYDDDCD